MNGKEEGSSQAHRSACPKTRNFGQPQASCCLTPFLTSAVSCSLLVESPIHSTSTFKGLRKPLRCRLSLKYRDADIENRSPAALQLELLPLRQALTDFHISMPHPLLFNGKRPALTWSHSTATDPPCSPQLSSLRQYGKGRSLSSPLNLVPSRLPQSSSPCSPLSERWSRISGQRRSRNTPLALLVNLDGRHDSLVRV